MESAEIQYVRHAPDIKQYAAIDMAPQLEGVIHSGTRP